MICGTHFGKDLIMRKTLELFKKMNPNAVTHRHEPHCHCETDINKSAFGEADLLRHIHTLEVAVGMTMRVSLTRNLEVHGVKIAKESRGKVLYCLWSEICGSALRQGGEVPPRGLCAFDVCPGKL